MNKEDFLYRISLSDLENENLLSTFIYPNLKTNIFLQLNQSMSIAPTGRRGRRPLRIGHSSTYHLTP